MNAAAVPQWSDLTREVDDHDGVYITTMLALRQMAGGQRLNDDLAERISDELTRRGYGHWPSVLPIRQEEEVMVYRLGRAGADVFDVVVRGATESSDFGILAEALRVINERSEPASRERIEVLREMSRPKRKRRTKA